MYMYGTLFCTTCEEIKRGDVHNIKQTSSFVVRSLLLDVAAVRIVNLPVGLVAFVVRPAPRVPPSATLHFPRTEKYNERL